MSTWYVGSGQPYSSISAALAALYTAVGTTPFTETHEIVITDSYPRSDEVVIENLVPTETYRLIIRGDTGVRPGLFGSYEDVTKWCCFYVKSPYVTIRDFRVLQYKVGVLCTADNLRLHNTELYLCERYGVQLIDADRAQITNTKISYSKYGIALNRSRENVIIHNSINCPTGFGIWIDWTTGNTVPLDISIPLMYMYNNIVSSRQPSLSMRLDHQRALNFSDGNVYWSQVNAIANLFQVVRGTRVDNYIQNMVTWRQYTNSEANSSFQDPQFLTETTSGQASPGLYLGPDSPVLTGGVPHDSFTGLLPSWVDLTILGLDYDDNDRENPTPTPGPTEYTTTADWDLFIDFIGSTSEVSIEVSSELNLYGVDRAVEQLKRNMECWNPEVAAGFFYVGDAAYYLYADKFAENIQEVTWSEIHLTSEIDITAVGIADTSAGTDKEVPFIQQGLKLWASHAGATFTKPLNQAVRVTGTDREGWDSSDQSFQTSTQTRYYPVKEYPRRVFLTTCPLNGAPIVITDDTVGDEVDRSLVPFEYREAFNENVEMQELFLQGMENKFENPHFHNEGIAWNSLASSEIDYTSEIEDPLIGAAYHHANVGSATQILEQTVYREDLNKDLVLSFYMNTRSSGHLKLTVTTRYTDGTIDSIETSGVLGVAATSDTEWRRYVHFMPADIENELFEYGASYAALIGSSSIFDSNGENLPSVTFRFETLGAADLYLDAFQVVEGNYVPRYAGMPYGDEMTIEYDSSDAGIYIVDDLAISPIINPQHSGFLTICAVPIEQLQTSAPSGHTTLSDSYANGRTEILPWAKIDGPGKYRYVSGEQFGLVGQGLAREVGFVPATSVCSELDPRPDSITVKQGLSKTFHVVASDQFKNPYSFEPMTLTMAETSDNPLGILGIREMGSNSKLGPSVTAKTDPAGVVVAKFISSDSRVFQQMFGTSDMGTSSITGNVQVTTDYTVNPSYHGHITLKVASTGTPVTLVGSEVTETSAATLTGLERVMSLSEIPVFRSLEVKVNGTSRLDRRLHESLNRSYGDKEYYVDYATGQIYYNSIYEEVVQATYTPLLAWVETSEPQAIQLSPTLVSTLTSDMIAQYDVKASIHASCGEQSKFIPLILMNPDF